MKKFNFQYLNNYSNHGQNAEQSIRFVLTGKIEKADNQKFSDSADCLNFQIKSARATVCKGTDIRAYLELDASEAYIYGANDGTAYIMNKTEYIEFVELFGTVTRESTKNGGAIKTRLKNESRTMTEWLKARA